MTGVRVYGLHLNSGEIVECFDGETRFMRFRGGKAHLDDIARDVVLEELRAADFNGGREGEYASAVLSLFDGSDTGSEEMVKPEDESDRSNGTNGNGEYSDIRNSFAKGLRGGLSGEQREVLERYGLSDHKRGDYVYIRDGTRRLYAKIPLRRSSKSDSDLMMREARKSIIRNLRIRDQG